MRRKSSFANGNPVQGENLKRLMNLAAQIAAEQDPKKFQALVVELYKLLGEKENRLEEKSTVPRRAN